MKRKPSGEENQEVIKSVISGLSPEALQEALLERCRISGLSLGTELLEQDVLELCGAPTTNVSIIHDTHGKQEWPRSRGALPVVVMLGCALRPDDYSTEIMCDATIAGTNFPFRTTLS